MLEEEIKFIPLGEGIPEESSPKGEPKMKSEHW